MPVFFPLISRSPEALSVTSDIPADVQRSVEGIPGLDRRVAQFLRHDVELEAVRQRRHSPGARALVERALTCAEADKAAGFDPKESFDELMALHQKFTARL